jgi:8-oxo-dGTP diphosphatase
MRDVAVGVLVRNETALACQRLRNARYGLKWEFPGGKVEPGESSRQALDRELQEELGITVLSAEEFHRQEWTYPEGADNPSQDGAFRVFYFIVRAFSGEPNNCVFEQIRWVSIQCLHELDFLEGNREAIERLADGRVKGSETHRAP